MKSQKSEKETQNQTRLKKNKKTQNQTRLKRERCRRAAGESRAAVKCRHGRPLLPPRGGTLLCNISLLCGWKNISSSWATNYPRGGCEKDFSSKPLL